MLNLSIRQFFFQNSNFNKTLCESLYYSCPVVPEERSRVGSLHRRNVERRKEFHEGALPERIAVGDSTLAAGVSIEFSFWLGRGGRDPVFLAVDDRASSVPWNFFGARLSAAIRKLDGVCNDDSVRYETLLPSFNHNIFFFVFLLCVKLFSSEIGRQERKLQ